MNGINKNGESMNFFKVTAFIFFGEKRECDLISFERIN